MTAREHVASATEVVGDDQLRRAKRDEQLGELVAPTGSNDFEVGSSRTSRSGRIDSTVASAARRASPWAQLIRVPVRERGADRGQGIVHLLVALGAP